MTDNRGGPSSADVFDRSERVYECAATVDPRLPHLRLAGETPGTWGVVRIPGVEIVPWTPEARAAAYVWAGDRNREAVAA